MTSLFWSRVTHFCSRGGPTANLRWVHSRTNFPNERMRSSSEFFQKLQVSCASTPDVWFEAFELDTCRKGVASAIAPGSSDAPVTSLVFEVKQLTNMHKQVVIQGQLITANHTTEDLEVKVTVGNAKDHRTFALNASTSLPSLLACDSSAFAVKVRGQGQRVQWSQDVVISDKSCDASSLVMVRYTCTVSVDRVLATRSRSSSLYST